MKTPTVTINLSRPVVMGAATVSALTMREPLVSDQLAHSKMSGNEAEKEIGLFANLCDVAPPDIHSLPMTDYVKLQKAYADFLSA